ncbi:MAG: hypothetical protein H8E35_04420 [Ardenticatenia bacterium]|nr:hypothetical protein [Ardenticatenia bacterium]
MNEADVDDTPPSIVQGDQHACLLHLTRPYILDDTRHVVEAGRVRKVARVHDC